ncbi:MAG: glycoside hydrolase family 3 protein [Candidatus Melainabacteria bacterium]|nr:glycoside hydrolase family 3 protein [Candidatus Melainabacteria bacterium]
MAEDIEIKLGQLFFVGFCGYSLSKEIKDFFKTVQPGGIVFFEHNVKSKKQVRKLIKDINKFFKIKPFIAVDQEGGRIERLKKICTSVPSLWELSKLGADKVLEAQKIIINELLELGFNMNFAPVLDINSNPKNLVIGRRAISNDPEIVTKIGCKIIDLYLKRNIIPVIKHFPGHGDTDVDSHLALPILNKSKNQLNNFELLPFKKAIKNNAPVIMVGHIQLPKIEKDKKRPASLSKNILLDLLRDELKFKGLIITDELGMKAVSKNYSLEAAVYEAINVGANMLLFNQKENRITRSYKHVKEKLTRELLNKVEESYKRIITIKNKFLLTSS